MTRRLSLVALLLATIATAQAPPPQGASLEELRDWAKSKVAAQEGVLKEMLDKVVPLFRSTPHGADSEAVRAAVQTLGERAGVFVDMFLDRLLRAESADVRKHLADVLVASGDPRVARACLSRLDQAAPETAALLVRTAGLLKAASTFDDLRAIARRDGVSAVVKAEAVLALARGEAPEAAAIALAATSDGDASSRRAACEALGMVGSSRDELEALRKLATTDSSDLVRRAALRALGRFRGNLDAIRTLHDALETGDGPACFAALDALEAAGTRDLCAARLLDVVRKAPPDVRSRAARVLMNLGSAEGVKQLFAADRRVAEQNPEDRDVQIQIADKYRTHGWYEGAIPFYERALNARGAASTAQTTLIGMARCYARLKRYDDVKRRLKQAGYTSLRQFADDPDFAEMREHPSHREAFK